MNQKEKESGVKNADRMNMTFDLAGVRNRSKTMKPKGHQFATVDPAVVRFEEMKQKEVEEAKKV